MSAADSTASPVPAATVYEEAEPDEEVPANDDEDETMYPELVDIASQQAVDETLSLVGLCPSLCSVCVMT